jgi:hypothetical protein
MNTVHMLIQRYAKVQDTIIIMVIIMCVYVQGEATLVMKAYNRQIFFGDAL